MAPQYSKAIVVVIDAFRYQFASWDYSYEKDPRIKSGGQAEGRVGVQQDASQTPPPFVNKMKVFKELLEDHPDRSLLFRFKVTSSSPPFVFLVLSL